MENLTRKFILEKTRSRRGAIVDAVGNLGNWPFRRTISYHVGINCDSISVQDGRLQVQRRGRTIAVAELIGAPSLLARLLHPRHRREHAAGTPGLKWEDMLRSRRK